MIILTNNILKKNNAYTRFSTNSNSFPSCEYFMFSFYKNDDSSAEFNIVFNSQYLVINMIDYDEKYKNIKTMIRLNVYANNFSDIDINENHIVQLKDGLPYHKIKYLFDDFVHFLNVVDFSFVKWHLFRSFGV